MRASIQSLGTPLAFRAQDLAGLTKSPAEEAGMIRFRTLARALEGMQKEAIVCAWPAHTIWRLVCDEGPYLNGTDLAPFPLAFYTAGLVSSYAAAIERVARAEEMPIGSLMLTQDNRYTMQGSALQGTMRGGALPVELEVAIESSAGEGRVRNIVRRAVQASPADACTRLSLVSTFTALLNGEPIPVPGVQPSPRPPETDPADVLARVSPLPASEYAADILAKGPSAQAVFGVEGGAGSSLQEQQKRTLHVRGVLSTRADGLHSVDVQLFSPRGSAFRILSQSAVSASGGVCAPCGLTLLSAGIAFCYLTQIGRYAHIVKQRLEDYRIVQHTAYRVPDPREAQPATAAPVDTHVFVSSPEPAGAIARAIAMGEQTCFLHANLREVHEARVAMRLNGRHLEA